MPKQKSVKDDLRAVVMRAAAEGTDQLFERVWRGATAQFERAFAEAERRAAQPGRAANAPPAAKSAPSPTPRQVLGVPESTSVEDCKTVYHALSRANHPDRARTPIERKACERRQAILNAAWAAIKTHES